MKFDKYDLVIINIISTKFYKIIHSFILLNE